MWCRTCPKTTMSIMTPVSAARAFGRDPITAASAPFLTSSPVRGELPADFTRPGVKMFGRQKQCEAVPGAHAGTLDFDTLTLDCTALVDSDGCDALLFSRAALAIADGLL